MKNSALNSEKKPMMICTYHASCNDTDHPLSF